MRKVDVNYESSHAMSPSSCSLQTKHLNLVKLVNTYLAYEIVASQVFTVFLLTASAIQRNNFLFVTVDNGLMLVELLKYARLLFQMAL